MGPGRKPRRPVFSERGSNEIKPDGSTETTCCDRGVKQHHRELEANGDHQLSPDGQSNRRKHSGPNQLNERIMLTNGAALLNHFVKVSTEPIFRENHVHVFLYKVYQARPVNAFVYWINTDKNHTKFIYMVFYLSCNTSLL